MAELTSELKKKDNVFIELFEKRTREVSEIFNFRATIHDSEDYGDQYCDSEVDEILASVRSEYRKKRNNLDANELLKHMDRFIIDQVCQAAVSKQLEQYEFTDTSKFFTDVILPGRKNNIITDYPELLSKAYETSTEESAVGGIDLSKLREDISKFVDDEMDYLENHGMTKKTNLEQKAISTSGLGVEQPTEPTPSSSYGALISQLSSTALIGTETSLSSTSETIPKSVATVDLLSDSFGISVHAKSSATKSTQIEDNTDVEPPSHSAGFQSR